MKPQKGLFFLMSIKLIGISVLFVFLEVILLFVSDFFYQEQEKLMNNRFQESVADLQVLISHHLREQEQVIRGLEGLFNASSSVSREEFSAYIQVLDLKKRYPGLIAVGYANFVPFNQLESFKQSVREDFPDFQVFPIGDDKFYLPVTYIEPLNANNKKMVGFDLLSEELRRKALTSAVSSFQVVMSDAIRLVQDNQTRLGVLIVAPIYRKNASLATESLRWQALQGFVYGAYHLDDLMMGLLDNVLKVLDIHVYEINDQNSEKLLLDTRPDEAEEKKAKYFSTSRMTHYRKIWKFDAYGKKEFEESNTLLYVSIFIILGTLINIFVVSLIYLSFTRRVQAEKIAKKMTEKLSDINSELTINETRFRLALESSKMGAWNWYLDSNQIHWDDSIRPVFDLDENVVLNTYEDFLNLVVADDRKRVFEEIAQAIEKRSSYESEYRVRDRAGKERYIATRAKIIFNEQSESYVMAGTCWDITEQKLHEKMKDEFVSVVSHELRTPLTAVTSVLSLLQNGALGSMPEKAISMIEMANKNAARLKLLINDLLDMEKIISGKLQLDIEEQLILPLVVKIMEENKLFADSYSIKLELDSATKLDFASVVVDPFRFSQVLTNFISNAVKFSSPESKVLIQIAQSNDYVRVSVVDKGIGIPLEAQSHMFEKFYQVDSSSRRQKGGTGLGLAITKELVELMGGHVGFTSVEGQGSCFYVEFKMVQNALDSKSE